MSEAVFTIAAILTLFVVAIPVTTLAAKLLLVAKRRRAPEITAYGSSWKTVQIRISLPTRAKPRS